MRDTDYLAIFHQILLPVASEVSYIDIFVCSFKSYYNIAHFSFNQILY